MIDLQCLRKRNYIPWESRFRRFLDNKLEDGERMWRSIEKGPYERPLNTDPDDDKEKILEPLSKMTESNKKQYILDVKVMNYLLQAIPNDIYNSVDASKEGESLKSVYERLTTLVNIRNNVCPIIVSINTKFINFLQPEWSKYVTMSRANPSCSHSPQPSYVTLPSSAVNYEEDYTGELQGDSQKDKLTTAMIVDIQTKNAGYGGNGNRNAGRQNRNQAFNAGIGNAMKDEAGRNLNDEENAFLLDNSFEDETLKELIVAVIMMARIQPNDDNGVQKLNYNAKAVSEVNTSHKMIPKGVHEHKNYGNCKTIINTSDDDQIDSNIIFDDPYVENNGGSDKHNSTAHDQYHDVKILAYNALREVDNKKRLNNELKKKKNVSKTRT
ncbi:hypothetical protein Tco_0090980 [Tanacetum coccineum]